MKNNKFIPFFLLWLLITICSTLAAHEKFYPLQINGKYGYINDQGTLVIKPSFEYARPFYEDLALIRKNNKYGFIDTSGELVFYVDGVTSWQWVHPFSGGLAAIRSNKRQWGFIDTNGNYVIPPQFYLVKDFTEGVAAVKTTLKSPYIYIDKTGKNVFPDKTFEVAHKKTNGYMVVGQQVYENTWIDGEHNGERIFISGIRYGVIDGEGNIVVPFELTTTDTKVGDDYLYCSQGFLNVKTGQALDLRLRKIGSFSDGVAPASRDGKKFGIIDKEGKFILPEIYDIIQTFSCGYAVFIENEKYGFLDTTGKIVIQPQFDFAMAFDGDLAFIRINGIDGYVTKKGKVYLNSSF
jgi:hypothetical protein